MRRRGGGGGAPPAKVAALQSITADAPLAAWAFGAPDPAVDRSGQINALTTSGGTYLVADLVPNRACVVGANQSDIENRYTFAGPGAALPWARVGQPVTINARVWVASPATNSRRPLYAVQMSGGFQQLVWGVVLSLGKLVSFYYVSLGDFSNQLYVGTLEVVPHKWQVLAFKRSADGLQTTFYVDGAEETIVTGAVGTWATSDTFRLLTEIGTTPSWIGNVADMAVFPTVLSKANLDARRAVMLGL